LNFSKSFIKYCYELQLGGWDDSTALWMLDSAVNRSSGAQIQRQLKDLDIGVRITRVIVEGPKL
jgi:hypothetical protein